jgi:hypothetical protein
LQVAKIRFTAQWENETATTTTGVASNPGHGCSTATTDDVVALAAAETAPAGLTCMDETVGTVVRPACGTMGWYVTNTAAKAIVGHAHNQAAAAAHLAPTGVGLVDGSQWDWASNDDDNKAHGQNNPHASEAAGLRDDEQAIRDAHQEADKEAHNDAHWTATFMAHRGDVTYNA